MIATRRRRYEEIIPVVDVEHPDAWRVKFKSTKADDRFMMYYASNKFEKVILDGVVYEGENLSAVITDPTSNFSNAIIPTPGEHIMYVYIKSGGIVVWDYNHPAISIRTPREFARTMYIYTNVKYLEIPALTYKKHESTYGTNQMVNIKIPEELWSQYTTESHWASSVRFMQKVKFNYIED